MTLNLYNTLHNQKEEFEPLKSGKIGMYVCGITAYDSCHLGHARAAIVFDVIVRYLRFSGYDVTYIRNYTDIDDKIIKRANQENLSCQEIATRYIQEYEEDMAALGVQNPDQTPKATEHIPEMIAAIEKLIQKDLAYEVNGSIYFSVRKFAGYGKLSGKNIEELESGARIDVDETKQDPLDFALWKASKPGEPKWSSPWGEGRPGWHIECSVMSSKYLGQPFDIHGGGRDLVFPHHENEIAQAEGACGCEFARYWLHNGFININAEKMSKSLGNIKTIKDIRSIFDYEVIRYFLLANHYRSPIDYTEDNVTNAERAVVSYYASLEHIMEAAKNYNANVNLKLNDYEQDLLQAIKGFRTEFQKAMDDDFNTASAIARIFDLIREVNGYVINKQKQSAKDAKAKLAKAYLESIKEVSQVLGFFGSEYQEFVNRQNKLGLKRFNLEQDQVEDLIAQRSQARKDKNFGKADEIRAQLQDMHIEVKDRPDGATDWMVRI
ncbi:MAG: cysteine--tRNA ligase [Pseudomonadota bacterium]